MAWPSCCAPTEASSRNSCPAAVRRTPPALRSKMRNPMRCSSNCTRRVSVDCEMLRAEAAFLKLPCWAAATAYRRFLRSSARSGTGHACRGVFSVHPQGLAGVLDRAGERWDMTAVQASRIASCSSWVDAESVIVGCSPTITRTVNAISEHSEGGSDPKVRKSRAT